MLKATTREVPRLGALRTPCEPVDRFDLDVARIRRRPHLAGVLVAQVDATGRR
jgi:hypothetical protein